MNEENKHEKTQAEAVSGPAGGGAPDESSSGLDSGFQPSFQPSTQGSVGTSAGAMLRHARETAGVDLSSLALALKISVKKLEALEANRHDELTDSVFIRALASSVCRTLKIDAAPILARLPKSNAPKLVANDETGLNAPFRTPADVAKTPFWEHLSRPVVLAALAVLLAALVLILLPSGKDDTAASPTPTSSTAVAQGDDAAAGQGEAVAKEGEGANSEPGASTTAVVPQSGIPAAPLVTTPVATQGGATPAFSAPASASRPAAAAQTAAPAPAALPPSATPSILARGTSPSGTAPNLSAVPARAAAVAPVAQPAAAAPAPQAAAEDEEEPKFARSGAVVFRLREPGWVQVVDASGTIRINRVLEANTPVGVVNGPFPLVVTIGRPEVTDVQVRGRPFDLTPTIANGQAKFEVR
ncbi:hypothetical protein AZ34_09230 [Hylemonella gracilis str. Niagara R]|uniref:Cytoskeleton protein RodZ-like C-terminal domain-containing protein n=1 Tax=Hylemonella gracilis str. Niagara R TaxID=1458275 RepID=A0A016XJ44_9BURK|nr:helix-turn-helix domain-containing protein [Hylemonella gracilis]EYC51248.1 hypothetical protein AZ34_09230 [Hylemonella gracilis str. Niagara R]